jgi:mannose-6-phosphate isomerase-like protein (cupin superfamily)
VVVRGVAEVTLENVVQTVEANQSVYIPIGHKHRLANPGDEVLEIIEVQTGALLSEDDIERFDDQYGR